jgi:Zn-finger nucleic acid-binding protein
MAPGFFQQMLAQEDRREELLRALGPPLAVALETKVVDLTCPKCQSPMLRTNFAKCSGVVIDVCRKHGIWFDANELQAVALFVREGGMERSRDYERQKEAWRADEDERRANLARMLPEPPSAAAILPVDPLLSALSGDDVADDIVSFLAGCFSDVRH